MNQHDSAGKNCLKHVEKYFKKPIHLFIITATTQAANNGVKGHVELHNLETVGTY